MDIILLWLPTNVKGGLELINRIKQISVIILPERLRIQPFDNLKGEIFLIKISS